MDDNTRQIIALAVTSLTTISVALIRTRRIERSAPADIERRNRSEPEPPGA
jgi:hypothetical protein